jgi:hypothetical protein
MGSFSRFAKFGTRFRGWEQNDGYIAFKTMDMKRRNFLGATALAAGALGLAGSASAMSAAAFAEGAGAKGAGGGSAAVGDGSSTASTDGSAAAAGSTAGGSTKLPPIVHHVFFWLKNPDSTADRDKLVEGLKTLAGIPIIRELHVGTLAPTEKRDVVDASWQVSELMFFDNVHDQAGYQQHPLHLDFVKNYSHLWAKVVVYDAMNVFSK